MSTSGNYIFLLIWMGCFLLTTRMPGIFMVNSVFFEIFSEIFRESPLIKVVAIEFVLILFILMGGGNKYSYNKEKGMFESDMGPVMRYLPLIVCILVLLEKMRY